MNKLNKVPYLATYYVKGVVMPNEDVIINYYATNFNQDEYRHNKDIDLKLNYKIDGAEKTIDIKAGDNALNLGKLSTGEKILELQVIDSDNLKSHRLFIEFKVKEKEELKVKEFKFNLSTPFANTKAINDAMLKAKEEGCNCLRLEENKTIIICENTPIKMISGIVLDLNKSTLKLNPNALCSISQVSFENCEDAHLTTGTIEGDYHEHDYNNAPNNSEWVNGIHFGSGARYCTVDNVEVKDITGYGINTGVGHSIDKGRPLGEFANIDIVEGKEVACDYRKSTKEYIPINHFTKRWLQIGFYLGTQGNATDNWVYNAHFYNENKEYIETIEGYGYRRLFFNKDAHYVRFTLHTEKEIDKNISIFNFAQPLNCEIKNVKLDNIRAVGMALGGFLQLLVNDCDFVDAGQKLGKCAVALEDGWDLMQDLTFSNTRIHNVPTTGNTFLAAAGHNIILEDNPKMGAYIWGRCRSYVVRGNTLIHGIRWHYDGNIRTAFTRHYKNTYECGFNVKLDRNLEKFIAKEETYNNTYPVGAMTTPYFEDGYRVEYESCKFVNDGNHNGMTERTLIKDSEFVNFYAYICRHSEFERCNFKGHSIIRPNNDLTDSYFKDCHFESARIQGNRSKLKFYNCTFDKFELELGCANEGLDDMHFENCVINGADLRMILIKGSVNIKFVNCKITHNSNNDFIHYISRNPKSTIEFVGCEIIKPNGVILDGYYKHKYVLDDTDIKVVFNNCNKLEVPLMSEGYEKETKMKVIIK